MYDTSWIDKNFSFFSNKECECFPCHEIGEGNLFNCLFCYCPLYALGESCGGNFVYYDETKDCSRCLIPHKRESLGYILDNFPKIKELAKQKNKTQEHRDNYNIK